MQRTETELLRENPAELAAPADALAASRASGWLKESTPAAVTPRLAGAWSRKTRYVGSVRLGALLFWIDFAIALTSGLLPCALMHIPLAGGDASAALLLAVVAFVACGVFYRQGLYSPGALLRSGRFSAVTLACCKLTAILVALAITASMLLPHGQSPIWLGPPYAGGIAVPASVLIAVSSGGALMAFRCSACLLWPLLSRQLRFSHNRVLVVGSTGEAAECVIGQLATMAGMGVEVAGILCAAADERSRIALDRYPVLGEFEDLAKIARQGRADTLVIALPGSAPADIARLLAQAFRLPVDVRYVPDETSRPFLADCGTAAAPGRNVLVLRNAPLSSRAMLKRIEDIVLASVFLLALAPLLVVIAMAIKLDSPGPVLSRQKRRGTNNQAFEVLKFRSTHVGMLDTITQTSRPDLRLTRIGTLLRRHSLDQLPQFLNVLRGDMSIVGPRPSAFQAHGTRSGADLIEEAVAAYNGRSKVKPGITGWAQVSAWRGEPDTLERLERRIEHDLAYMENWSLLLDLRILLRASL